LFLAPGQQWLLAAGYLPGVFVGLTTMTSLPAYVPQEGHTRCAICSARQRGQGTRLGSTS